MPDRPIPHTKLPNWVETWPLQVEPGNKSQM